MKGLVNIAGVFHINVSFKGKRRRRSTHTGHRPTAERAAMLMLARRHQLQSGQVTLPSDVDPWDYIFIGTTETPTVEPVDLSTTIEELQMEYVASLGPPKISKTFAKTQATYFANFARFRKKNSDLPKAVKDWQPGDIEKYRMWRLSEKGKNKRGKKVRAITVHKEVAVIRKMFDYARRKGLIELNPVRDLERIPDDAPDATFRTYDEIIALEETGHLSADESIRLRRKWLLSLQEVEELKCLLWSRAFSHYMKRPGDLALFMNIAADAGLRLGEIGRLTTLDIMLEVDKGTGVITARSRKQSRQVTVKERHVPIEGDLVRRLANWLPGLTGRRLFHECPEDIFRANVYRALDSAIQGTKFFGIRPHLLRHALRTNMYEVGVDEILIDAYLGHTTKEMGEHYRHIRAKRLANGATAYAQARAQAAKAVGGGLVNSTVTSNAEVSAPQATPKNYDKSPPIFKFAMIG